ncbi:fumarylacetoacetase [Rodentibacter myodis]|uniref:fumarylacetoacetase n=1 Tax=Rodentibacter myodis TaxID=1907939 RepID=UPI001ABFB4D6|nr:fumarylacetoacetase [Rodentibacter myodis]
MAIGDFVVDLSVLSQVNLIPITTDIAQQPTLNPLIALGRPKWQALRNRLQQLLSNECSLLRDNLMLRRQSLIHRADVLMHFPLDIPDYTDFYSSKEHAYNVGCMFRGEENALMPNWSELPVGYNGRAGSIVISGTNIHRPCGQIKLPERSRPIFSACRRLDFELETGFIIGYSSQLGQPVSIENAAEHIFGMVLLNDWSAREIQQWEYIPLSPFNAKTFGTSISVWVVTMEALEPFRCPAPNQEPKPLKYLREKQDNNYDISLQVILEVEGKETIISDTNFKYMYWTMAQQLTHHTVSGCNLRIGDLMGSGTISGPTKNNRGSLLELTWNGSEPIMLESGNKRTFIEDGDTIIMRGYAQKGHIRVGFGEVRSKVLPANHPLLIQEEH